MGAIVRVQLLLLFVSSLAISQQHLRGEITDFLISGENVPSTFQQSNVRLFPKPTGGFLAVWQDNRNGDPGFYAQNFDADGNRVANNFPLFSNQMIEFTKDDAFLALKEQVEISYYSGDGILLIDGMFYDSSGQQIVMKELGLAYLPWCGTGYLGVDYDCASTSDQFIFLLRDDGRKSLSKYDRNGNLIFHLPDSMDYTRRATLATVATNASDEYMMAWFEIDKEFRTVGCFGTFFDSRDSIVAQDKPLGFPLDTTQAVYKWGTSGLLRVIPVSDTAYQIFSLHSDSAILYYRRFDARGNPLGDVQSLPVPHVATDNITIANFSISTTHHDTFNVLLTTDEWYNNSRMEFNALYTFSADGIPVGDVRVDTTQHFQLGEHFIKTSESTFLIGVHDSTDAYVTTLLYPSSVDSLKLNDDPAGSNETAPLVTPVDDNHFFVSWQDEVKTSGQMVDLAGNPEGGPVTLEGKSCEFFPDRSCVTTWLHDGLNSQRIFGFTLYDPSWNAVLRESLTVGSRYEGISGVVKILTDSTFAVLYPRDSGNIQLALFDHNGVPIVEVEVAAHDYQYNLEIFINDQNSFWVRFGRKVRLYSNWLEPLSDAIIVDASLHLEGQKFLRVVTSYDYYSLQYYGMIVSTNGDTLKDKFLLTSNVDELTFGKLTPKSFVVVFRKGKAIYAKAFSNDGVPAKDSIVIHTSTTGSKKQATYTVHNTKVFFAWSEARPTSPGFSIFGSIVEMSTLVNVREKSEDNIPSAFRLDQNYPNPFNPSTTIQFEIQKAVFVTLKVYNMLGQEITTLVNEVKSSGNYATTWNAADMPSGVYFYQLKAGNFTDSKKLLLIR